VNRPQRRRSLPLRTQLLMLAAGSLVCWTILGFALQYFRTYTLAREADRLERRRHDLLIQNASLLAEINRLRTDDRYLEELARGQLGMLRPGERELVIIPAEPALRPTERDSSTTEPAQAGGVAQAIGKAVREATQAIQGILDRVLRATLPSSR
jgi:cell division protein FtsB